MQHTLRQPSAVIRGTGLHTGRVSAVQVLPAPQDTGIVFERKDLAGIATYVPALYDRVAAEKSTRCTFLENEAGVMVQTPEHLMAALAGYGIDNAIVQIDGPEVPLMDGSAQPFLAALMDAGRKQQGARDVIEILKTVRVQDGDKFAELRPLAPGQGAHLHIDYSIAFDRLGAQHMTLDLTDVSAFAQVADSRTFTKRSDVEKLLAAGLIKGGSIDSALIIDDMPGADGAPAPDVFYNRARHADEPVRHKIMDAIGDLALAGRPIIGQFVCAYGGHALTNQLLRALFDTRCAWRTVRELSGIQTPVPAGIFAAETGDFARL
ncbi:MAG: UDP-3-O-[3-hydroxymyristoyl] N-acetylglucosamine deacetylase [Rhodospirillales bacterium]|nr:UDP-3-O-[3-hydroxymyristoyl] N-acetylglucosamine deacetylase [Alphaproteobacteria bacterium]MCB9986998.1 UDP-3-O-[3-hydroxymyristoyl] N-acetylglucosamine deacetylase [Rhodospirillales bacterium]USO08229.1 MAG: UDP-3-O-[3-hydroxymyristoyl] N-acetylglucosamine deacetylase [Rhodospirillales bacterium]